MLLQPGRNFGAVPDHPTMNCATSVICINVAYSSRLNTLSERRHTLSPSQVRPHIFDRVSRGGVVSQSLFPGFIEFNRNVMVGISKDERSALRYKWTLASITELLTVTHAIFIGYLDRLSQSTSLSDAAGVMRQINEGVLEESFRVEGLCEAFEGLGDALLRVNQRTRDLAAPSRVTSFSLDKIDDSEYLAHVLSNREFEVARLYIQEIRELRDTLDEELARNGSLQPVLARADSARAVLTEQLADFQRLASDFRR